jgi:hypothetical protein
MENETVPFKTIAVDFDGTLCYSKWPELGQPNLALIEYLQEWKRNGNKLILWTCRVGEALSNSAGNKTSNLMPSMTTFRKSSNSMDTTAGRFPVITISTTGCCFRKTQRHRTRNGAMPLCLFWHSFLVSAGYLPNTVFLIIKIC